jgi:glucose dehydrogenase
VPSTPAPATKFDKIEASGHTTPCIYQGHNGKQYVVVEAFGAGIMANSHGDSVIAYFQQ